MLNNKETIWASMEALLGVVFEVMLTESNTRAPGQP